MIFKEAPGMDGSYLEGLNKSPQQRPDAFPPAEKLHQSHHSEKTEKGDGDSIALFRVLRVIMERSNPMESRTCNTFRKTATDAHRGGRGKNSRCVSTAFAPYKA